MPAMGRALRADVGMVEWIISGYLIGFSLGQLLWGPIGDRHGRQDGHIFLFAIPSSAS
jgi:DHA1 family bicyclomycin/chloramphenicol resistance-like MFS transporter